MTADTIYEILRSNNHANSSRIIAAAVESLARERNEALERVALLESLARTGSGIAHSFKDEVDRLTADNAQANQWLVNGVAKIAELEKQLDEARGEVERLRPGYKAWRAWEGYSKDPRTTTWDIFQEAANIARENK